MSQSSPSKNPVLQKLQQSIREDVFLKEMEDFDGMSSAEQQGYIRIKKRKHLKIKAWICSNDVKIFGILPQELQKVTNLTSRDINKNLIYKRLGFPLREPQNEGNCLDLCFGGKNKDNQKENDNDKLQV